MQPAFKPSGPQGDWAALAPSEELEAKTAAPRQIWPVYPTPSQLALEIYTAMRRGGLYVRHNEDGSTQVLISDMAAPEAGYKLGRTQATRPGDKATRQAVSDTLLSVQNLPQETMTLLRQGLLVVAFGVTQERYDQTGVNEGIRQYIHDGLVQGGIPATSIESSLPNLTGPYLAPYITDDNWQNVRDALLKQAVGADGQKIDDAVRQGWKAAKDRVAFIRALTAGGERPLFIVGRMPPEIDAIWDGLRTIYIMPRPFLSVDGHGRISIAQDHAGDKKTFDQTLEALKSCRFIISGSAKKSITARVQGYDEATGRVLLADEQGRTLSLEDVFGACGGALRFDLILPGRQTLRMVDGVQLIPPNVIEHANAMSGRKGTAMQGEVNGAFYAIQSAIDSKGGASFDAWDPAKSSFADWNRETKWCPDVLASRGWELTARMVYDLRHAGTFGQFAKTAQRLSAITVLTDHLDMDKFGMLRAVYGKLREMEDPLATGGALPSRRLLDEVLGALLNSKEHVQHCGILKGMLDNIQTACLDTAQAEWFDEPLRSKLLTEMYEPVNKSEKTAVETFIMTGTK